MACMICGKASKITNTWVGKCGGTFENESCGKHHTVWQTWTGGRKMVGQTQTVTVTEDTTKEKNRLNARYAGPGAMGKDRCNTKESHMRFIAKNNGDEDLRLRLRLTTSTYPHPSDPNKTVRVGVGVGVWMDSNELSEIDRNALQTAPKTTNKEEMTKSVFVDDPDVRWKQIGKRTVSYRWSKVDESPSEK